jgi:hypothetical protein
LLRRLVVQKNQFIENIDPDGPATRAFEQVVGVTVGVHIDLDFITVGANRTFHIIALLSAFSFI